MMLSLGAGEGYWLGASDIKDEGFWITESDGTTYTGPYGKGQPVDEEGRNCLAILTDLPILKLEPGSKLCDTKGEL